MRRLCCTFKDCSAERENGMFEKAKWITRYVKTDWGWGNDPFKEPPSPYMTRDFEISERVRKATLNICGLGQAAYYVNGVRIPDSYLPTLPFDPMKTVIYNAYNITAMLKAGNNRLGAILGNNGYNDIGVSSARSCVKLICCLEIEYFSSRKETVVSDTRWKTHDSHVLFSLRRSGEKHNANREIKNWCSPEFDNSDWNSAVICPPPGGKYRRAVCPPVKIRAEIKPEALSDRLFDFKTNSAGWVRLRVKGKAGDEIAVRYAERLDKSGQKADQSTVYNGICAEMCHTDRFVLSGGEDVFEQLFGYHSFRYAEIEGDFENIEVTAVFANTYAPLVSDFECDDSTVNAIHGMCINSLWSNLHGALTDCPGREQNEWTGDGLLSAEACAVNFSIYNVFYEWMLQFKDAQLPSGALPCIIPVKNPLWEYNFANGPDWDSAIFHIPYYLYKYTGNLKIVKAMWNNMQMSLNYFSTLSETRLLKSGVGDWCCMGDKCYKQITDTVYYRIAALMMSEMAEAIGKNGNEYKKLADEIRKEFRAQYIKNGKMTVLNETALSAAIFGKMLDAKETAAAAAELNGIVKNNGYRFLCGVHGLRMIFDALSDNGYTETVYKAVTNPKFPGYAYCVKKGLTSLPERFDFEISREGTDSLNHHFRSPVDVWFYKYLAGIRIDGFGYGNITISPQFVSGISELHAAMHGINVSYNEKKVSVSSLYDFSYSADGKTQLCKAGNYVFNRV